MAVGPHVLQILRAHAQRNHPEVVLPVQTELGDARPVNACQGIRRHGRLIVADGVGLAGNAQDHVLFLHVITTMHSFCLEYTMVFSGCKHKTQPFSGCA